MKDPRSIRVGYIKASLIVRRRACPSIKRSIVVGHYILLESLRWYTHPSSKSHFRRQFNILKTSRNHERKELLAYVGSSK